VTVIAGVGVVGVLAAYSRVHESFVHTLPSLQTTAVPPHAPPEQVSFVVQALPSLHKTLLFTKTHPNAGSQVLSVQTFPSLHTGGGPPTHAPPEQASFVVQALLSLQAATLFTCTQPDSRLQESSVQTLPSLQLGGGPPTHDPPEQTSPVVQALPSLHGAALLLKTQTPPWHVSVVHTFPSLHWLLRLHSMHPGIGVPPHVPPAQTSAVVQG
jgi:hypothetical protein